MSHERMDRSETTQQEMVQQRTAQQRTAQQRTAQQLRETVCTAVLVWLTVKAGLDPANVMPHMAAEVRDTVRLYLQGRIVQWYSQCDAPGVMFVFQSGNVEEVRGWMAGLPLVTEDLVELTFVRLGPLVPLRLLL